VSVDPLSPYDFFFPYVSVAPLIVRFPSEGPIFLMSGAVGPVQDEDP